MIYGKNRLHIVSKQVPIYMLEQKNRLGFPMVQKEKSLNIFVIHGINSGNFMMKGTRTQV
jgi:hypothetical protein